MGGDGGLGGGGGGGGGYVEGFQVKGRFRFNIIVRYGEKEERKLKKMERGRETDRKTDRKMVSGTDKV